MTQPEIDFLLLLAQTPFLPVGRALGEETPIFENDPSKTPVLEVLEKKSLISIDYRSPLKGCEDGWYLSCPVQGSLALTARGQQVLDLIDYQGILEQANRTTLSVFQEKGLTNRLNWGIMSANEQKKA